MDVTWLAAKESGLEWACVNNDNFTVLISGGSRPCWVSMCTVWLLHSFKMTERAEQRICIKFCTKLEHSSAETIQWFRGPQVWATGDWQLHRDSAPTHASCIVQRFLATYQVTQVTEPPYSPDLVPYDFWLFPKPKPPLKGKRFQTINEIKENTTGQLMVVRTVWSPNVPTLRGT